MDIREGNLLSSLPKMLARLRRMPRLNPVLIFLEASHEALVRRFSETRRPHPLAPDRSATEGIRDEHTRMRADPRVGRRDRRHLGYDGSRAPPVLHGAVARSQPGQIVMTVVSFGLSTVCRWTPISSLTCGAFRTRTSCRPAPRPAATGGGPSWSATSPPASSWIGSTLPAVRGAVLHRGRQELPDGGHRLYRRPAPLGHDRGASEAELERKTRRAGARPPSRRGPRMTTLGGRCRGPVFGG